MNTPKDVLRAFLNRIRHLNFFQRLFSWRSVRNELIDATESLFRLESEQEKLLDSKQQLDQQLAISANNCYNLSEKVRSLEHDLAVKHESIRNTEQKLLELNRECIQLRAEEETRQKKYDENMTVLNKISEQIHDERETEKQKQHEEEIEKLKKLKETWVNHQAAVNTCIRNICMKHAVEFADKVPFKGEPDNTIKICDEYIVFDAKSPAGDDATNFFNYLKSQAEAAKKYAGLENVKKDIFFVVPANTAQYIKQNVFNVGDYNVYIIFTDSLEPLILGLKKIEDYEFAGQLSPDERENICRIIGKFAHLTKRRIQIDSFFAKQFMEIVYKCESNLPEDILEDVAEFERSEKLNPPTEKRSKAISNSDLQNGINQLEADALNKGIVIKDLSEDLNKVRLYRS